MATPRSVDDCPYRHGEQASDTAECRLLTHLSGLTQLADRQLCHVGNDACEACCQWFAPTEQEINPIIASFLYQLATQVLKSGGAPGCDAKQAAKLQEFALANIPDDQDVQDCSCCENAGQTTSVPQPARRWGPPVERWAVGVTTAPRQEPTLTETLVSLQSAGWGDARLFIDGEAPIPREFAHLAATARRPRIGAWPNYYLGLSELLLRHPDADAVMMVQDDVLFANVDRLRAQLEQALWPAPGPAVVSLFCSRAYTRPTPGWHKIRVPWVWGAQAFVFGREAAQRFLADRAVVEHRWTTWRNPLADIDWLIGQWAYLRNIPLYCPTPSLAQHIGHVSALWKNVRAFGNRRAARVAGNPVVALAQGEQKTDA